FVRHVSEREAEERDVFVVDLERASARVAETTLVGEHLESVAIDVRRQPQPQEQPPARYGPTTAIRQMRPERPAQEIALVFERRVLLVAVRPYATVQVFIDDRSGERVRTGVVTSVQHAAEQGRRRHEVAEAYAWRENFRQRADVNLLLVIVERVERRRLRRFV